jgi:hypothetical protein
MRLSAVMSTAGLVLAMAAPASAATFTVPAGTDGAGTCTNGTCTTIHAALTEAAKTPDTLDTITLTGASYALTSALPLNSPVTLAGAGTGATRITAAGKAFRVFTVTAPATIQQLRATGGNVSTAADPVGGVSVVEAGASLTLDHVWLDAGTAARGGGLANRGGTLTLTKSVVSGSTATADGGGILNLGSGTGPATLSLTDVTVASNKGATAGGIESLGSATNAVTATRATIAGNTDTPTPGTSGLSIAAGSAHVGGSLVTGGCDGTPTSDGGNVETTATCGFTQATDKANVSNAANALVAAALVATGTGASATQVLKITATSAAVDASGGCAGADQRDAPRPQGAACDAGAYELPAARIDDKPPAKTDDNTPTFAFSSTVPGVTFQCSLRTTGTSFTTCPNPYPAQVDGTYTFAVRAVDGGTAGVATSYTFTIDTPPATAIQSGPNGPTNMTSATFTYNANELNSTFQCKLEGPGQTGAMAACSAVGKTYAALTQGNYTFTVLATDVGGNPGVTPATRAFTVDTTPPVVSVTDGPPQTTQDTSVSFAFASEPGTTYQCRLDTGTFKTCTSPIGYDVTAAGSHTFTVRATDLAGNSSAPATRTYTLVVVAAATPTPTPEPAPEPTAAPTPAPVIVTPPLPAPTGFLLTPVHGTTLVQVPGSDGFEPVDGAIHVASGTLVDARTSRVRLVDGTVVSGGTFELTAAGLQLVERLKPCAGATRRLTIDGAAVVRGRFATVTGSHAKWSVQDSCTSTTTRVTSGTASVRDQVRRKTVRVRARHSYIARSKR